MHAWPASKEAVDEQQAEKRRRPSKGRERERRDESESERQLVIYKEASTAPGQKSRSGQVKVRPHQPCAYLAIADWLTSERTLMLNLCLSSFFSFPFFVDIHIPFSSSTLLFLLSLRSWFLQWSPLALYSFRRLVASSAFSFCQRGYSELLLLVTLLRRRRCCLLLSAWVSWASVQPLTLPSCSRSHGHTYSQLACFFIMHIHILTASTPVHN